MSARGSARETRGRYERIAHWLGQDVIKVRLQMLDEIIGILTSSIETMRKRYEREGWQAVMKVTIFAVLMDFIYQYLILDWVYPIGALFVAFTLAFVPYLLIRGPVNRIARMNK